jgi:hypothetical protein
MIYITRTISNILSIYIYSPYIDDLLFYPLVIPLFLQTDGRFWAAQLMEGLQDGIPGVFLGVVAWVTEDIMGKRNIYGILW